MQSKITIIFAYRNRNIQRIKLSLNSLELQSEKEFEVQFIDFGSTSKYVDDIAKVTEKFAFVNYHYIAHEGLLWNKSKALNFGINISNTEYIVLADVDVLFATNFVETCIQLAKSQQFSLFKIGYLPRTLNSKVIKKSKFLDLKPTHIGDTFGIGLFSKAALVKVRGLDTFFHFFGSEDEDLNSRLQKAGFEKHRCEETLLLHQWHPRYPKKKDKELTIIPRLTNIQRINQRHFHWQRDKSISIPKHSENWYQIVSKVELEKLKTVDEQFEIHNIKSHVVHFLQIGLPSYSNKVVEVVFRIDPYYNSTKYKVKKVLNKISQPYISLKEINDLILKEIIFKYLHHNYWYEVSNDLESIKFIIDLKNDLTTNGK